MKRGFQTSAAVAALLLAGTAQAHSFASHGAGFVAGLAHPFTGLDHLLALLAVGVWAVAQGGRAVWLIPAAFLGAMMAGALLAWGGMTIPLVEAGVIGSVLVLGWLIGFPARLSLAVCAGLAVLFALFHGQGHALAMPPAASAIEYGSGLMTATGLLLAAGVLSGRWLRFRDWLAWHRPA